MRAFLVCVLALSLSLAAVQPALAQQAPVLPVSNSNVNYDFGVSITFSAQLSLPSPASEVNLLFVADGETTTRVEPLQLDGQGNTTFTFDMAQDKVRPYSTVHYKYHAKLQSGEELESRDFNFTYEDTRFKWQSMKGEGLTVHWYNGQTDFAQKALDVGRRGLDKASSLLLSTQIKPINVYIYASNTDLQDAMELAGVPVSGGHASPDLRVALVAILPGPEEALEMEQKIPHEIGHILTYDLVTERYARLPVWLREGIASQVELSPNPDYPRALAQATEQGAMIPISDLCGVFPPESGRQFLAYAESASFTSYLLDEHGRSGLQALIGAYGDGLNCEQGMQQALGNSLSKEEKGWLSNSVVKNDGLSVLANLFPYMAILLVLLAVPLASAFLIRKPK